MTDEEENERLARALYIRDIGHEDARTIARRDDWWSDERESVRERYRAEARELRRVVFGEA